MTGSWISTCDSVDIFSQVTAAAGMVALAAFGVTIAGCVLLWVRYVFGGKS